MKKVYQRASIESKSKNSILNIEFYYDVDDQTTYDDDGVPMDGYCKNMEVELINKHDGTSASINFGEITYAEFISAFRPVKH